MTKQEVTKRLPLSQSKSVYENGQCSVIAALKLFATKWKPCILCFLSEHPMRYNALFRAIPNISRKMLSQHLDELEKDALLSRVVRDPKLQHVEYRLSSKGLSLLPLLDHLQDWGMENIPNVRSIREMLDATRG